MAVKIRMKRTGGKNDACFRLVAADERSPRDGRNLEILGWYDPAAKGKTFALKLDRVDYWLGVGAKITDTAASLVRKARNGDDGMQDAPVPPTEPVAAEAEAPVEEQPVETAETTEAEAAVEPVEETAEEAEKTDA